MFSPRVFWPYFALVALVILAVLTTAREFRRARGLAKAYLLGSLSLAIPMAVFGAEHLSSSQAIMTSVPVWMPARLAWTYFVGVALIAAALSIVTRVRVRLSATLLGIMLFCFVAMIHLPNAIASPHDRIAWTIVARDSSFGAGGILLGIVSRSGPRTPAENRLRTALLYLIGAVTVFFGVEHFLHPECVPAVPLGKVVPGWIPLGHFWTVLTGILLVAGGGAMFVNRVSRQAAAGLGIWVLCLVLSLYLALMIAQPDVEGVNYFTDTMVYAGVLLIASQASESMRQDDPSLAPALAHEHGV